MASPPASGGDRPVDAGDDTGVAGGWPLDDLQPSPDVVDVDRDRVRAKLKAELFQIESEPVRIGRFPILGRLGQGGMGTVFSAFDAELDRKIAVKVMLPSHGAAGSQGRERTRREAQAMARLSHPNIVAVHEVGLAGQQVFIAMEFVRGVSLDVWLAKRTRTTKEILAAFRQAGLGLAAAHEAGLVHRDFKPSNVMVGDDGQVKILDFGLARAADEGVDTARSGSADDNTTAAPLGSGRVATRLGDGSLTRTGAIMGTPAYMAPEQHHGRPATAASDQFSFCVALYAALYKAHPFGGENLPALVSAVCDGAPAPPPKGSTVPAWIRRAVVRGLSRDPDDRFVSMTALLDALADDPGARRRRWMLGGTAVAVVLAAGFGIARLGRDDACPDGRASLQGAWDDGRRRLVSRSLRDGAPHGAETWSRVESGLDAYATEWAASREEACRAMRSGAASNLLYERRVACLSRSRSALDALVEVFEQADATVVEKAVGAVAGLPPLARCEDNEGLLAQVEPPAEAIAPEVTTSLEQLARARSMEDAGRLDESVAATNDVLAEAERLEYPPLVARALLRRGSAELLAGKGDAADDDLGRATWIAIEVGDAEVAAEAAVRRIFVHSELRGRPADAQIELPWARSLVEATDADDLRGLFLHNAAAVMSRAGDPQQARELARQALSTRRTFEAPDHPEIAQTLANLGHFERDLGDYDAAITTLREAVRVTEVALGPRHPQRAMIGIILGTALFERGDYGDAARELALTDAIFTEILGADAMMRYYVLVATGELAVRQRRWADARRSLDAALALAEPQVPPVHPMLSDARLASAEVTRAEGDVASAEASARAAVADLETGLAATTHPYVASAWLRLGRLLLVAEADATDGAPRPSRAEPVLRHALEIARGLPTSSPSDLAWYELWHIRSMLAETPSPVALATAMQTNVDALVAASPESNPRLGEARLVLADAWLAAGDRGRALALLERERVALVSRRDPDDPELVWLAARIAPLRWAMATDVATRDSAVNELQQAIRALAANAAWAAETRRARTWLEATQAARPTPEKNRPSQ